VRRPTSRCKALAAVASSLVTFSLGVTAAVFVAGAASAASPTTTKSAKSTTPKSPAAHFFVINGTVNAASAHEIAGSSAFPNFATGAVDNYYALAHSHVDNSPSAEGRASPADSGPIGQTAAAGHFQQPQYADARWPGDSGKATYGSQGGPYAVAEASEYHATAEASLASNGLSGPSGSSTMAVPKGFDGQLRLALAEWEAKWQGLLSPKKPADTVTTPKPPTVTTPKPPAVTTPKTPTVTTPSAPTVTTPTATLGGPKTTPPVTAPPPAVPPPTLPSPGTKAQSRSLAAASPSADGASLLASSTLATLDPKTNTLVTSGESSLGRVSLGGGQIVIKGIHVSASIANDGSPTYKVAVSVAAASIGGVPVTIDQDGVHVAGQGNGLPYQQASDALNGALKQAGIQLFLVAPEVTTSSCAQPGAGTGTGPTTTRTTTTTTSSDQSGTTSSCDQTGMTATCDQTGTGTGTGTGTTTTTTGTTTTTTTTPIPTPVPTPPSDQPGTTTTTSSCDDMGTTKTTSSCGPTGTATGTTTTSNSSTGTTTTPSALYPPGTTTTPTTSSSDQMGADTGTTSSGQQTVRATGLHVVFTQPVNQSGVPAQNVEHIFGEVFVDSLAVPAGPLTGLGLSSSAGSTSSSSCLGGGDSGQTGASGGASIAGGGSSGSLSPSASTFSSASQPASSSSSNGNSLPAALASALRKPLWLLLAYLLWQALVIGTGVSLWNWRRGDAS